MTGTESTVESGPHPAQQGPGNPGGTEEGDKETCEIEIVGSFDPLTARALRLVAEASGLPMASSLWDLLWRALESNEAIREAKTILRQNDGRALREMRHALGVLRTQASDPR